MGFCLFTDTNCDMPASFFKENRVGMVTMLYGIGTEECEDDGGETNDVPGFYRRIRAGETSVTWQATPERYEACFRPVLERGEDILYIAFSSGLTKSYDNAVFCAQELRREFPERSLHIVDSMGASAGQALLVYHAILLRDAGKSAEEIAAWCTEHRQNIGMWFTVNDLQFLKRGGRVSATSAFLGSVMDVKPVLHVDEAGRLVPIEKVRGRKRALKALVDRMEASAIDPGNQTVFISHGDCEDEAREVGRMIEQRFGTKDIRYSYIGPVIGTHSGPGTVALFFYAKER